MAKGKKMLKTGLLAGWMTMMATSAYAKPISLKDAGIALWVFIAIGAIIVLLQLIPAIILFFSFVGTTSGMVFGRKKSPEKEVVKEKAILPGYEPATVKK